MSKKLLNWIIPVAGIILTTVILFLDDFEKDSKALTYLVVINFITIAATFLSTKKKRTVCWLSIVIAVIAVHIFLLFNATGWNTASMEGNSYLIPFLKDATDFLYGLLFFSAFLFLIPLSIYGIFIFGLIVLFCENFTSYKNNDNKQD